jgi:phosphohistidine phosphatase
MRLLLIRHASAVPAGTPGIPDAERRLTPQGERKFKKAARGLARLEKRPAAILTSPLPRARRTAEIAAAAWGRVRPVSEAALATGHFPDWEALLASFDAKARVAVVGHEPHLSMLLARLVGTEQAGRLAFRKGGVAIVDLPGSLAEGGALVAFLTPKALRALAGSRD